MKKFAYPEMEIEKLELLNIITVSNCEDAPCDDVPCDDHCSSETQDRD